MPAPESGKELVLVFESRLLDELGRFQGISRETEPYLDAILGDGHSRFIERRIAERDPSYKQLIPYVILRCDERIFHYVRGRESGEARLRAKGSIGIGGHIEPRDLNLFTPLRQLYLEAAAREVAEEVLVEAAHRERIIGLLNDDSTSVGRVHFGIVHLWDLDRPAVRRRERQITRAQFLPVETLSERRDELETWSSRCLDLLIGDVSEA
jgi:predicted NUDIX family phosphoesterase